jgi:2-amino-4-hydroxy-6-hydroxymethyldihydropteridine diphosphokinase
MGKTHRKNEKVYIALGSNKGDRVCNIIKALRHIEERFFITRLSSFIRTSPAENAEGGFFLNGVVEGRTGLSPLKLFEFLQDTEKNMGRKHPHKRGDEREIDLDIIFYGGEIIRTGKLTIPHPGYRKRVFVVSPLYEIAPGFVDPETGQTVSDVYKELSR